MARANLFDPDFELEMEGAGFRMRGAPVVRQAGAERLGGTVYELGPGETPFPYHYHRANEELLVVLSGRPSLRTPEGWRELEEGDVVSFPAGPGGGHQLRNRSDAPARYLMLSQRRAPEIAVYPDSGKLGAADLPRGDEQGSFRHIFRIADAAGYWDDERPPED